HRPIDRTPRCGREPGASNVRGHLAPPVQPFRGHLPLRRPVSKRHRDPGGVTDRVNHHRVGDRPRRDAPLPPGTVGSCSNLHALLSQDANDRLDCIPLGAHLIDEFHDHRLRGSSSPAKKVVAALSTATSSRSRLFSAFNRLISASSVLVWPSRSPASISAWRTQRRSVSEPTPSWRATATMACALDGYSLRCSRTSLTARSRSADRFSLAWCNPFNSKRCGTKPTVIHSDKWQKRCH